MTDLQHWREKKEGEAFFVDMVLHVLSHWGGGLSTVVNSIVVRTHFYTFYHVRKVLREIVNT